MLLLLLLLLLLFLFVVVVVVIDDDEGGVGCVEESLVFKAAHDCVTVLSLSSLPFFSDMYFTTFCGCPNPPACNTYATAIVFTLVLMPLHFLMFCFCMHYFVFAAPISYHQQGPASTSYIGRVRLHTLGGRALSVTGSAVGTAAALVGSASGTSTLGFSTRSLPKFDDGARTFRR